MDDDVRGALVRAARGLVHDDIRDLDLVLSRLVAAGVDAVPGAVGGAITRGRAGVPRTCHATEPAADELERRQYAVEQGPAPDAAAASSGEVVWADDLAGPDDAQRWPRLAAGAVRSGYRSAVSARLASDRGDAAAVLTLYSRRPGAFPPRARSVAGLFAAQASLLLHGADHAAMLQRAVESRDLIGQAKGLLMERFALDATQAFELLVTSSQETNVKLVEVARWLTRPVAADDGRRAPVARHLHVLPRPGDPPATPGGAGPRSSPDPGSLPRPRGRGR